MAINSTKALATTGETFGQFLEPCRSPRAVFFTALFVSSAGYPRAVQGLQADAHPAGRCLAGDCLPNQQLGTCADLDVHFGHRCSLILIVNMLRNLPAHVNNGTSRSRSTATRKRHCWLAEWITSGVERGKALGSHRHCLTANECKAIMTSLAAQFIPHLPHVESRTRTTYSHVHRHLAKPEMIEHFGHAHDQSERLHESSYIRTRERVEREA